MVDETPPPSVSHEEKTKKAWQHYISLCECNDYGFPGYAMNHFDAILSLHGDFMPLRNGGDAPPSSLLPLTAFPSLVESFRARKLETYLCETQCHYDTTEAIKKMGEYQGTERVDHASYVVECCMDLLRRERGSGTLPTRSTTSKLQASQASKTELSTSFSSSSSLQNSNNKTLLLHLFNALMSVMLSGGFANCQRVFAQTYDALGVQKVCPNLTTYLHTIRALSLCGELTQAQSLFHWLRSKCPENLSFTLFTLMFECYRENRNPEAADALWADCVASNASSRLSLEAAELYLRDIVDRAYTPLAGDMAYYGQPNHAEMKKIPLLVDTLRENGLPPEFLSPVVKFHINDALICYRIPEGRKYAWARSKSQFSFLNMRRAEQYVDDLLELTSGGGMRGLPQEKDQKGSSGIGPYYGRHGGKKTWESTPADSLFYQFKVEEQKKDTRMESKNTISRTDLYERGAHWMAESPQTRYDHLYAQHKVDFRRLGVRRHLDPNAAGSEEDMARDAAVVASVTKMGQRLRRQNPRMRSEGGGGRGDRGEGMSVSYLEFEKD